MGQQGYIGIKDMSHCHVPCACIYIFNPLCANGCPSTPPGNYKDIDIRMTISTYIVKAIINATLGMGGRRRSYDRVHIRAR